MPTALPVPSKGALRALRQIALGTSCTVAFGAGLITEDRRRRIQSAREVSENARLIKASRRYHSSGVSAAATFEEQIQNYCQNGPWKGGDRQGLLDPKRSDEPQDVACKSQIHEGPQVSAETWTVGSPLTFRVRGPLLGPRVLKAEAKEWELPKDSTTKQSNELSAVGSISVPLSQQERLTGVMMGMLQDGSSLDMIYSAIATLSTALADGLRIDQTQSAFLDACILLAEACERHDRIDLFAPILQKLLTCSLLDEKYFYGLRATKVISHLMKESGYNRDRPGADIKNSEKLGQAVAVYLANFHEKPKQLPSEMLRIGHQLSIATVRAKLYDLTEEIYQRLLNVGIDGTFLDSGSLILASRARGDHQKVLYHFTSRFLQANPNQSQFYAMVGAAVQSALDLERLDKAEEIIPLATQVAEANKLQVSTTWLLQILGEHWRMKRNLASTQALFHRLEPTMHLTSHPQAIYSAIIQFCVEAGREEEAEEYLNQMKIINDGELLDIRTRGHLALAKAMRNDWKGVEADFKSMKTLFPDSSSDYTAVFVPILKQYAASHQASQVEEFLRYYIEEFGLVPSTYISNLMIGSYCKSGEINCIPLWVQYAQAQGLELDAVSFNVILTSCRSRWGMKFDSLYRLCNNLKAVAPAMIDSTTIRILHGAAIVQQTDGDPNISARLLRKVDSLRRAAKCPLKTHIDIDMRKALAEGNPKEALRIYQKNKGGPVTPQIVALAVRASIQASDNSDPGPATDLLNDARSRGVDIYPSITQLLLYQIEHASEHSVQSVIIRTLVLIEERDLEITLPVATKVVSVLVDRGLSREAIAFWNSLSARYSSIRKSIDIAILTVLLRAYILHFDYSGIRWVIHSISQNDILPDKIFKSVLKNARREAHRFWEAHPHDYNAKTRCWLLDESLRVTVDKTAQIKLKRQKAEETVLGIMESAALTNESRVERAGGI